MELLINSITCLKDYCDYQKIEKWYYISFQTCTGRKVKLVCLKVTVKTDELLCLLLQMHIGNCTYHVLVYDT